MRDNMGNPVCKQQLVKTGIKREIVLVQSFL